MKRLRSFGSIVLLAATWSLHPVAASDVVQPAAPSPAWYTDALHNQVMSSPKGVPAPKDAPTSAPSLAFTGLRPGTWIISPNWCTANYLFTSSGTMAGTYYLGLAKHCAQAQTSPGNFDPDENVIGKPVVALVVPTTGAPPTLMNIGAISHATARNGAIGDDYALIQIRSDLQHIISPSIALIGGPTSVYRSHQADPVLVVGHGTAIGTGGTARPGLITSYNSSISAGYGMVIPVTPGDSGAPVRTSSGAAVGNVTHSPGVSSHFPGALSYGSRVTLVEDRWDLKVVVCTSIQPWPLLGCP